MNNPVGVSICGKKAKAWEAEMAAVTNGGGGGGGGAAPSLQLVHGHPVVASFFHTISAGAARNALSEEAEGGENAEDEAAEQTERDSQAKRSQSVGDNGGADTTSEDAEGSSSFAQKAAKLAAKKRKRSRNQKPSHVLRREEKAELEREVRDLEARASQLRDAMGLTGVADALSAFETLREAVARAREQLGAAHSVLSELARHSDVSPLHSFVRLPRDWAQRRALLLSMRARKLQEARRFLAARTRHLAVGDSSFTDQSTWTTVGGDACGVRLEVTPFRGVGSPQRVVDALLFYFIHLEISLSEQTGNTAVREDDEGSAHDPGVLHHRLQISMPSGEVVEKSSVLFVDRPEAVSSSDKEQGSVRERVLLFMAGDFVDQDDRFPYSPTERVRKDISTLIQLAVVRPSPADGEGGERAEEPVVVMTKWQFLKLHAARELQGDGRRPLSTDQLEYLHANHMRGLDAMVATMRQFLYGVS
jgi:hypothetical protein